MRRYKPFYLKEDMVMFWDMMNREWYADLVTELERKRNIYHDQLTEKHIAEKFGKKGENE